MKKGSLFWRQRACSKAMRPLNIYALTRVKDEQTLGRLEKQLSRRGRMLKIKQWEIEGLRAFSDHLCRVWEDASELDFYFSFTMPKLGKEFDLLRINDDSVINIELKSGNVTDEAIQAQLLQNRYYLATLGKAMHFYTYVDREDRLLRLSNAGRLLEAGWQELAELLKKQTDPYSGAVEELFKEDSYLISPLSDPARFLRKDYFLTSQQRDIRKQILRNIAAASGAKASEKAGENGTETVPVQGFTGLPGTGKTLLLYDLAMELSQYEPVCVLHFGAHAKELEELDGRLKRVDFYYCDADRSLGLRKRYTAILIDEGHRIGPEALCEALKLSEEWRAPLIVTYDREDELAAQERALGGAALLEAVPGFIRYRLTNRIRLNNELSSFIRRLLCFVESGRRDYPSVQAYYANDTVEEEKLLNRLKKAGFTYVRSAGCERSEGIEAREAACKEYEKVLMLLDESFYYDEKSFLRSSQEGRVRNVFHGLSRARKEMALVIRDNPALFSAILRILQAPA